MPMWTALYLLAHEEGEDGVRLDGVVQLDAAEGAALRVHGGLGYVYSAVPPLFKLTRGKNTRLAFSEEERGTACGIALDDIQLSQLGVILVAVPEFVGHGRAASRMPPSQAHRGPV